SGTATASAGRVAALDHEAVDHAVEDRAVVERSRRATRSVLGAVVLGALRQSDEVRDGLGGVISEESDLDVTAVGVQGRGRSLYGARHGMPVCPPPSNGLRRVALGGRVEPESVHAAKEVPMSSKTDVRLTPSQRLGRGLKYSAVGPVDVTLGTVGLSVQGATRRSAAFVAASTRAGSPGNSAMRRAPLRRNSPRHRGV